jgi:hypothetical protein
MWKRTFLVFASLLCLVLIGAYTMVPVNLKATYSNKGNISYPMVVKDGTSYLKFGNIIIIGLQKSNSSVRVLVSPQMGAEIKSFRVSVRTFEDNLYWKVQPPCGVPVRIYSENGHYVFEAEGIDECRGRGSSIDFLSGGFPLEVRVETTVRKGLRLYRAWWLFLVNES